MNWYINTEWQQENKGLRKVVLELNFSKLEKPHLLSTVKLKIVDINNLDPQKHVSKYVNLTELNKVQQLEMGSSQTAIDCYLELLLQQMIVGEKSRCFIQTKSGVEIFMVLELIEIIQNRQIHELSLKEIYDLAQHYKQNGVSMYTQYPIFAHDYFARAAKCLISLKPFSKLTLEMDGVDGAALNTLYEQLQTNLAACLLIEKRYEHVIYMTQFVETSDSCTHKSIYRRAVAYYHLKEYEKAMSTLEKLPNYNTLPECKKLVDNIRKSWKESNAQFKTMMQRMFSN